jgi:hypothetical protein
MTDFRHDDEFDAYLKRRVPIDRRLGLMDRLEPPPELDRIVIGNARQAIQSATPTPVFRAPRWALSMGLAATILISLSILLDVGMQGAIRKDAARGIPSIPATISSARVHIETEIETAPWPPVVEETPDTTATYDARSRFAERSLAASRLREADETSGSARPASSLLAAAAPMDTVIITGTRIR